MLKRRPCRLQTADCADRTEVQTVQTECYYFFYLYLNFLVKSFAVAIWPVTGQGFQNTKWLAGPIFSVNFAVHSMAKNKY